MSIDRDWQEQQILVEKLGDILIICCANAEIAINAMEMVDVDGIITDMEMQNEKNGEELILWIKKYESIYCKEPCHILLNTALTRHDYDHKYPKLKELDISYLCKGLSQHPIDEFIKICLEKITRKYNVTVDI